MADVIIIDLNLLLLLFDFITRNNNIIIIQASIFPMGYSSSTFLSFLFWFLCTFVPGVADKLNSPSRVETTQLRRRNPLQHPSPPPRLRNLACCMPTPWFVPLPSSLSSNVLVHVSMPVSAAPKSDPYLPNKLSRQLYYGTANQCSQINHLDMWPVKHNTNYAHIS